MNVQTRNTAITRNFPPAHLRYGLSKRLLDIVLAGLGLIILGFASLVIWLLMRLEDKGPLFFRQKRRGLHGSIFTLYKFRTMRVDAEQQKQLLKHLNEVDGPVFKIRKDPRVTRLGRILRKFSIDELPQVINVLRGEMSIVGPRPLPVEEVDLADPRQLARMRVLPGLTCYWQISGRSEVSFEDWMKMDEQYIRKQSLREDLRIILKTISAVIGGRGAY
jgi:lipopolysaccharide/colanic/teichoic acid biosynthesis glycosyltransferase